MTQEELGFYNKQDKEELVIMCIARDNKIEHLRKEIDGLVTVIDLAKNYMKENSKISLDDSVSIVHFYKDLLEILERVNEE